jgi:hypothetical protein
MSDPFQLSRPKPIDPSSPRAPEAWVWMAGIVILGLASYGLYRGITGAQTGQTGLLPTLHGGVVAPVDAANINALPHDDQWSTLSGPKVLPPVAVKVAKPAQPDESSAPDAESAAADNADTGADDTPQPVAKTAPQKPVTAKPAKPAAPPPDDGMPSPPPPDGQ